MKIVWWLHLGIHETARMRADQYTTPGPRQHSAIDKSTEQSGGSSPSPAGTASDQAYGREANRC